MATTLERLWEVFVDVFEDEDIRLSRETTAADIDEWDSLMHVSLMLEVERAFGLRFSSVEVGDLDSVGELVDLIESKLAK